MPLTCVDLRGVTDAELTARLAAPAPERSSPTEVVREILDTVRRGGDEALRELTLRYDGVEGFALRVPDDEVAAAPASVPAPVREALEVAHRRILAYHEEELEAPGRFELDGVRVRKLRRPVGRAGLYAPGGQARYPSTVLMCAVPAQVAGVPELVLCAPPGPDGHVAAETLAAAAIAGVHEVYAVGGAQAIGALAFGTQSVGAVDVIVGPGNSYVAEAKRQVAGLVGVPSSYAGPSEVVVVADGSVPARWSAVDLVVQAEHGPDGLAWLVTWSPELVETVTAEVGRLVASSPRKAPLESTLRTGGFAVVVDGPEQAMAVANTVAPEHLELHVADPDPLVELVRNAGAVFVGAFAPASVGDYLAGPNHVLPTARSARFASALRVADFCKDIHVVDLDERSLEKLGPTVCVLAEAEGLPAHALSVRLRLQDMDGSRAGP